MIRLVCILMFMYACGTLGCDLKPTIQIDIPFPPDSPDDLDNSEDIEKPIPPDIPKNNLVYIKTDTDYAEIIDKDKSVLYFYADWCGPCKQQAPVYKRLAADNPQLMFYKIDTDQCPQSAQDKGVSGIPSIFVRSKKFVGFTGQKTLQGAINALSN